MRSPSGGRSHTPLERNKAVVVEGPSAHSVVKVLLAHMDLLSSVDVRSYGGVTELGPYLRALKEDARFPNLGALGVIRDAETSATSAFQSVQGALRNASLPTPDEPLESIEGPPKVSVLIVPHDRDEGMIETVCYEAVKEPAIVGCVEEFWACVERQADDPPNIHKSKCYAYLASRRRPDIRLGDAAREGYFDWDHSSFEPLRRFLTDLFGS